MCECECEYLRRGVEVTNQVTVAGSSHEREDSIQFLFCDVTENIQLHVYKVSSK